MKIGKYPRPGAKADPTTIASAPVAHRRLFTGGLAVGATLPFMPGAWTRPLVQSVLLPAHAQTSPISCSVQVGCTVRCGSVQSSAVLLTFVSAGDCVSVLDPSPSVADPGQDQILLVCIFFPTDVASIVIAGPGAVTETIQLCGNPAVPDEIFEDIITVDGNDFVVTATITSTGQALVVSELGVVAAA